MPLTVDDLPTCGEALLTAAKSTEPGTARWLQRAWHRGEVVRVAPGVYMETLRWAELPPWGRHVTTAAALARARRRPPVFTGLTAALLMGLPVAHTPAEVTIRRDDGHRGRARNSGLFAGDQAHRRVQAPLGRPPRVRPTSAHPPLMSDPVWLTARTLGGLELGTVLVDPPETVALTLAACLPPKWALAPLDALMHRRPDLREPVEGGAADLLPSASAERRFLRTWDLVEPASESAGESLSRALMWEAGISRPQVQREHHGPRGEFLGRTDFWWEEVGIAGEFDGAGKYGLQLHGSEAERRRSIRREQDREVRLRRHLRDVVHWTWRELSSPQSLAAVLVPRGVPLAR
ncbi:hypothetical protein [Micrococcus sp.]|uniref:hypothetical protein n=1 Tax=Micrococcus sp. TaxID=1271 RepID=UPI002A90BB2B|nr:hypothetical protein [Micrococcus sp.]MDY6055130.1 hypothetical protein [Micrococcus sp.]